MKKILAILSLFAVMQTVSPLRSGEIDIVKDGKAKAVIIQGRTNKCCTLAVEVLRRCIEKGTGVRLEVIRPQELEKVPAGTSRIFVGDCDYAKSRGLDSKDLQLEEYLVKVSVRDIFLLGYDKEEPDAKVTGGPGTIHPSMDARRYSPATMWAVADLLDREAGVRFLWPGDLGTYCPKRKNISIANGCERKDRPFYVQRQIWYAAPQAPETYNQANEFMMTHRQGRRLNTWFIDNFLDWWKRYSEKEPEIFALGPDRKRGYWVQPEYVKMCISNPRVGDLVMERWRAAGRPDIWSLCPNDGKGFCVCENCRKMDSETAQKATAEEIWNNKIKLGDRYVKFWTLMLLRMKKENPNVKVCVFGYGPYSVIPAGTKLDASVLSAVVPPDFEMKGESKDVWKNWADSGAKLVMRPNWLETFFFTPYLPLEQMDKFMRDARNSLIGYEICTLGGCYSMNGIYYYYLIRSSYRPDLSLDDIRREYASAFGKAAPEILAWFKYFEDYTKKLRGPAGTCGNSGRSKTPEEGGGLYDKICLEQKLGGREHFVYGCWDTLPKTYSEEVMAPAYKLLDEAAKKVVDDPEALARIQFMRDGQDHIAKMRECMKLWKNVPLGRSPEFLKSFMELQAMRKAFDSRFVSSSHHQNYNEVTRKARMVPFLPSGKWPTENDYISGEWLKSLDTK